VVYLNVTEIPNTPETIMYALGALFVVIFIGGILYTFYQFINK